MAKHEWVCSRLDNWARWLDQRGMGQLGYPKASPFTRLTPSATSTDSDHVPVDDLAAQQVQDAVGAMRFSAPHLWLMLHLRYWGDPRLPPGQHGGPRAVSEVCRSMAVAASTFYAYQSQAHERLALVLKR